MEGVLPGRIVHYVDNNSEHFPAVVSKVWGGGNGCVNLHVFDGHSGELYFKTSVIFSEDPEVGKWHWPERTPTKG